MGNNACCTEHANDGSSELVLESGVPTDRVPDLNANVVNYLNTHSIYVAMQNLLKMNWRMLVTQLKLGLEKMFMSVR